MSTTKKKKRILTKNTTPKTAETALFTFPASENKRQQPETIINTEIAFIKKKYNQELHELSQQKFQAFETLRCYAENNRDIFGNKKGLSFKNGWIDFRTGMPKLNMLKDYPWNSVISLFKKHLPGYIRVAEEPAKNRLLTDRFLPEIQQKLKELGMYINLDEVFYVEPGLTA
ncbi:host-nuclease inhibitor Gam family protein [Niabella sp. 22666]|uniref:host-nuclease inhibitor Gam family protein n=1 Tax=Niabella sp. 22666 TaxID=3453954 RepID=UPI003F85CFB1